MNHAMRLLVIAQNLWMRHGFWVGVALLLGVLSANDGHSHTPLQDFWRCVFLPVNAALTAHMLYQGIASRSPEFAAVGSFIQLWLARWLAHLLGALLLAVLGRAAMNVAPASVLNSFFEAIGMLLVTLAGIWFLAAAVIMPFRFISAAAQQLQKHVDQCRRAAEAKRAAGVA